MRNILKFGIGLALTASAALCATEAQARRHAHHSAAPAQAQTQTADEAASQDTLIIGKTALTRLKRRSLDSLAVRWTDWMLRYNDIPGAESNSCNDNQHDSIWYLMDSSSMDRDPSYHQCKIPANRYILVPIAYSFEYAASASREDCSASLQEVKKWTDELNNLRLTVDGKPLTDFSPFRVSLNKCPASPQLRHKERVPPHAIDGYWVILPPLSRGHHEIRASYHDTDSFTDDSTSAETYQIDVQ